MNTRKSVQVLCGLVLGAAFLTIATFLAPLAEAQGGSVPLTQEQLQLVAEKAQQRAHAGLPPLIVTGPFVSPRQAVRLFVGAVQVTKAELQASLQASMASNRNYLASLERQGGTETVRRIRERYAGQQRWIDLLSDHGVALNVPGVEVGTQSISFSTFTYDSSVAKDPTNLIFYRVGSSYDVQWDLQYWTSNKWRNTECGSWQQVYIWDAQHTGGWNGWRGMEYQMEPTDTSWCGTPRDHLRLFGSFVRDSHSPGFGWWTVGAAHHDNWGHTCTDDWDGSESRVADSFKDAQGRLLWFVSSIWTANLGNSGTFQCADNNGQGTYIELNQ